MISIDGYTLTYYKDRNQIIITLPQTQETITNTYEQVSKRRVDVPEIKMVVLLNIVQLLMEGKNDSD